MKKSKVYPKKFHALTREILFLIDKEKPTFTNRPATATVEKITAMIFSFWARETKAMRTKIQNLEAAQLPFENQRPAPALDNSSANPKADCHGN